MTGGSFVFEPRVIGAAFNTANSGKVVTEPIEGSEGVFAIKVDNVSATSVANANIEDQRKQLSVRKYGVLHMPQRFVLLAATLTSTAFI